MVALAKYRTYGIVHSSDSLIIGARLYCSCAGSITRTESESLLTWWLPGTDDSGKWDDDDVWERLPSR